jgi:hypothetical protein
LTNSDQGQNSLLAVHTGFQNSGLIVQPVLHLRPFLEIGQTWLYAEHRPRPNYTAPLFPKHHPQVSVAFSANVSVLNTTLQQHREHQLRPDWHGDRLMTMTMSLNYPIHRHGRQDMQKVRGKRRDGQRTSEKR